MGFHEKPLASATIEQKPDGWEVVTRNVAGVDKEERFFYSKAEAQAYYQQQSRLARAENA
ncbi:hypothetical protein SAMN02927900_01304 [Rhizobium mongolense subsp. loessense]|uniref:ETC complex I subunit-like protein n=1 Tax=Rhizobium mongolense subsp. loessense TaxID=158890 RepID=A0A1G4Q4U6_9HYPH|nr:hypothetical protein [Rhizobium mongolense]SCW39179.1 hypothetical protein SAMN02927900_01304 [Rhizobium mongolense subsp. loessense]